MVLLQGVTTWPLQSALIRLFPLRGWSRTGRHHALGEQPTGFSWHQHQRLLAFDCHLFSRKILSNHNWQVLRLEAQQRKKERQAARKAEEKRLEEEEVDATITIYLETTIFVIYSPG